MSIRIKRYGNTLLGTVDNNVDYTQTQRETTVDGYTFHWGVNEVRNFLDEGVGVAHGAFAPGANIVEDKIPRDSRS